MMQSLKGQALMVISALPPETSWDKLLQALKIKYQDKASYDVLMAQFYGTKIEPDEKCASFGTRLEQKLKQKHLSHIITNNLVSLLPSHSLLSLS